jgi:hypothetical protein
LTPAALSSGSLLCRTRMMEPLSIREELCHVVLAKARVAALFRQFDSVLSDCGKLI